MRNSLLLLLLPFGSAFVVPQSRTTVPSIGLLAVALEPEPEGGEEVTPLKTMAGCRMKKMEELKNVKSDNGPAYQFWMTATVDGNMIKDNHTELLKNAKKKANFPGFRKGQVPPYAMPQITQFSIQEAIIKTVEAAVDVHGLKALSGSDGQVEVKEKVEDMVKGYKLGDPIQFTAVLNLSYNTDNAASDAIDELAGVVDVAAEEV
ncbi:hypothetical protein FisN_2Lh509 [Fistulifera solaris]|uniref:Trigger factor ribosome-binding bacterial domain-containing protein n=1 Tax=Fistulifera solaris TaxID=1519565 RepID=A0A1Z5JAJ3_FISSO|nr:hypothetical protein FisN_2Lh509 [Fistulifera solaris]|eukprot:GAX10979.1 hypothetical protein FisN_2Lh509 [Fistulifera solaris]